MTLPLGEWLRAVRLIRHQKQDEVAEILGINQETLSRYERCRMTIPFDLALVERMADYLDAPSGDVAVAFIAHGEKFKERGGRSDT